MAGFLTDELLYFTQHKAMFAPQLLLSSRIMGPCQLQQPVLTTTFWFFQIILFSDFFSFDTLLGKNKDRKYFPLQPGLMLLPVSSDLNFNLSE